MQLTLRDGLILTRVAVAYQGQGVEVPDIVVDTGSATTMLSTDVVAEIGIVPELHDVLRYSRRWRNRGCLSSSRGPSASWATGH